MANDPIFMIGCEVGLADSGGDRPLVVGKYTKGSLDVKLTKPGKFGTLRELLTKYDVAIENLPQYVKDALELETTLQRLEYRSQKVATFSATDRTITPTDTNNTDLANAAVISDTASGNGNPVFVIKGKDGKKLANYSVSKDSEIENEYVIGKASYTFVVVAQYRIAFELVPGLMGIKFLAFSISNIEATEALEKEVDSALKDTVGGRLPDGATKQLTAQP